MTRETRSCVLVVILALVATPGCGTVSRWEAQHQDASVRREQVAEARADSKADRAMQKQAAQQDEQLRRLQRELLKAATPDALAAAALVERLLVGPGSTAALDLAARATAAAPHSPELALVQLQLCASAAGCDAAPLEARLLTLDPQNGIAWTYALALAAQQNDGPAWQTARAGLAGAQRVDVYWNRIVVRLGGAIAGKAGLDATTALTDAIGLEHAYGPQLAPVTRACSPQDVSVPRVLEECRRIATALRRGDTLQVEAFGTSLALQLWSPGSAESREIALERRALRYQVDLMGRNAKLLNSPRAVTVLAPLLSRYPSEQAALRAQYRRLGLDGCAGHVDRPGRGGLTGSPARAPSVGEQPQLEAGVSLSGVAAPCRACSIAPCSAWWPEASWPQLR